MEAVLGYCACSLQEESATALPANPYCGAFLARSRRSSASCVPASPKAVNYRRVEGSKLHLTLCLSAEQSQVGCRELRSTKYISDGHCTSINPIKELVCAGECLPAQMFENWIGGARGRRYWARRSGNHDWRCVNDKTRTQRIQLQCQDGTSRTYKITVVTSCRCKRYSRQHNESGGKFEEPAAGPPKLLHKHKSKSKRRLGKSRTSENWHDTEP
uniref:Sclerostin domain-containing protein 1 n=1 Tax=Oryzias melastigma TaxID=30732 RepID=A0A3B3D133_ORYME